MQFGRADPSHARYASVWKGNGEDEEADHKADRGDDGQTIEVALEDARRSN